MKLKWFLLSGVGFYFVLLLGVPFSIHAGPLYPTGNKLVFSTLSSSLAQFVSLASAFEIRCEEGGHMCAVPSAQSKFRAGVPIPFEPCLFSEISIASQCSAPELHLSLNTRNWLVTAVGVK